MKALTFDDTVFFGGYTAHTALFIPFRSAGASANAAASLSYTTASSFA
jgi:hypothetical protein